MTPVRTCRGCGCTELRACTDQRGPCWWVDADLCSHCETPAVLIIDDYVAEPDDECPNCGGEGVVYCCFEEFACIDPEGGCEDCEQSCDWCRP